MAEETAPKDMPDGSLLPGPSQHPLTSCHSQGAWPKQSFSPFSGADTWKQERKALPDWNFYLGLTQPILKGRSKGKAEAGWVP